MPRSPDSSRRGSTRIRSPVWRPLSRLAFHWSAGHDQPRALEASVRAGQAAQKVNAAEQVTLFERALSLWDRVPDAETVAGLTRDRAHRASGPGGDAAARPRGLVQAHPASGRHARADHRPAGGEPGLLRLWQPRAFFVPDPLGPEEAIRLAVEYAGEAPSEERAWALRRPDAAAQPERPPRGCSRKLRTQRSRPPEPRTVLEALVWGLNGRNLALAYLGRLNEASAGGEELISAGAKRGHVRRCTRSCRRGSRSP